MTNPDPQASAQAGTERLQEWFGQTLPDLQAKATSEEAVCPECGGEKQYPRVVGTSMSERNCINLFHGTNHD